MNKDFLNEHTRAEDILLGALGFDEDAKIIEVSLTSNDHYSGTACWGDGEEFSFLSDTVVTDLERWAVGILSGHLESVDERKSA